MASHTVAAVIPQSAQNRSAWKPSVQKMAIIQKTGWRSRLPVPCCRRRQR